MTRVGDLGSYLAATGWHRAPETWRGASVWTNDGYELLLPERDDLGDSALRIREALAVLAAAEGRPAAEIARDVDTPAVDVQLYRTATSSGTSTLEDTIEALTAVRTVIRAAARAAIEGPHPRFRGAPSRPVGELVRQVELLPAQSGLYTTRIPLPADQVGLPLGLPLGRVVAQQLQDAVRSARDATQDPAGDRTVTEAITMGLSANLCDGLTGLAGTDGQAPFEIGFRWARSMPAEMPAAFVAFGPGAGAALRAVADRLRDFQVRGRATMVGLVESLHDDPERDDRWRVKVRGELDAGSGAGTRRVIWVRLPDQRSYDTAIAAHLAGSPVRVSGALTTVTGRVELRPDDAGLTHT